MTGVDAPNSQGGGVGSCGISADANSGNYRSGEVTIVNSETNFAVKIIVNQAAYVPDVYVFTWGDGSITDLPTGPFKANEPGFTIGPPRVPIISTKNGTTHGYSVTSKPSWITVDISDVNGAIKIDIDKNTSTSSRSGSIVLTQNDSDKTLTITISQTGYEYIFEWYNNNVVESTDINSYTYTVTPGFVFDSTSIINTLVSTKSVDDWATNVEKADVTVIDTPENNWLAVTVSDYGITENPGLFDVKLTGTVPDSETTYTVQLLQHESAKVCLLKIVVESKVQNLIQISSANYDGKYNVYFQAADPVASDVQITYTLIRTGANGNTNAVTMRTGQRIAGVIGLEVTGNDYEAVRIELVSPKSDSTYAYTYSAATVPIEYPTADRFEVGITNNSTGAPVSVTLQGGDTEISTEDVPIGGSVWSGWADSYVNGIVNLKHDYASGDYFYVNIHREDGSSGWVKCEWSESGATSSLNGYLTMYEHGYDNEIQMIVNNNVDGYISEGTFGELTVELNDQQYFTIIFEHHPNL